jgi:RNA polymerase sigma-70 factor (ECF subfamily)
MFIQSEMTVATLDTESRSQLHERLPGLRPFFALRVDANDVEDMMQDVALRLQMCERTDEVENGRAYLYRVARSVVTDQRRRRICRQHHRHDSWSTGHEPVDERSPERVLAGKQQLACAMEALHELPERTRRVFKLHRFEHMPCATIAKLMEISISAVEKHIMRATRHMAAAIAA